MNTIIRAYFDNEIFDLDVLDDSPIRVDISAIENDAIGEVFGSASQTFTLPGSRKNNRFFKHAYKASSLSTPALNESVRVIVITDGDTMLEGSMFLEEVSRLDDGSITYNVIVTNDVVSFNEKIKTRKLVDLDWSFYNHDLSVENITSSWEGTIKNTNGDTISGSIFYPLIDMGSDGLETTSSIPLVQLDTEETASVGYINNTSTPLQVNQFTPAMSVKLLLDTIFEDAGFSYSSSLEPFFENVYILPKQTENLSIKGSDFSSLTFGASSSIDFAFTDPDGYEAVPFSVEVFDNGNGWSGAPDYKYVVPSAGTYAFRTNLIVETDVDDTDPLYQIRLQDISDNTNVAFQNYRPDSTIETLTLDTGLINLSQGRELQLQIRYFQGTGATDLTSNVLSGSNFTAYDSPLNFEGGVVSLSNQFDVQAKCIDIIKGLVEKFNLVIEPIRDENRLFKIENYTNWINSGERKDWTDKVDKAKKITTKSPLSSQPKTIIFEDIKDNDKLSKKVIDDAEGYQWGTEIIDAVSDTPQGERKVGFYFSPIILEQMKGGNINNVIPQLYKTDDTEVERKTFKFKPRIGYKVNGTLPLTAYIGNEAQPFTDYATISNYDTIPVISGSTKNLHWNESFYPPTFDASATGSITAYQEYWDYYISNLYSDEVRLLSLDMEFDPNEIRDIKLNDKIFVEGILYRINKIKGFNLVNRDVVNVELITAFPDDNSGVVQTVWGANKLLEFNVTNNTSSSLDVGRISWNFDDTEGFIGGPDREVLPFGYYSYIEQVNIPISESYFSTGMRITGSNIENVYATFIDPDTSSADTQYIFDYQHKKDGVVYLTGSTTESLFQHGVLANDFLAPTEDWTTMSIDVQVNLVPPPPLTQVKNLELNITNNTTESLQESFMMFALDDDGTRVEGTGPFANYFYYISQSDVPVGVSNFTGSILLTSSLQSSNGLRISARPEVPSVSRYAVTASFKRNGVEAFEVNDGDGLFVPYSPTFANPTESLETITVDVVVDYTASVPTPPETASIEVASILLVNGDCDTIVNPTGSFEGRMFVTASWNGFTTNGSGKLVVDNGGTFTGLDTPTYNPTGSNVTVVSESVDFPNSTQLLTLGATYMVQTSSLIDPIIDNPGEKIQTTVDLSATASFQNCEL